MADSNPTDCSECSPTTDLSEETKVERIVLAFLLEEHPIRPTIPELCRALYAHPNDFDSDDVVERAIRDLDGAGLVHCDGGYVAPSRAALCFARLEIEL